MQDYGEPTATWDQTLSLLHQLTLLWSNQSLSSSDKSPSPLIFTPRKGGEAVLRDLRAELLKLRSADTQAVDIRLSFRAEDYAWVMEPISLRAMVLLDAGNAVRLRARYLRCWTCQQWFEMSRADQHYCSSACRGSAFRASSPSPSVANPLSIHASPLSPTLTNPLSIHASPSR